MEPRISCGFLRHIAVPLLSTKKSPKPLKPHLPQVKKISILLRLHTEEAMDELDAIQAKKGGLGQREQWVRYPTNLFYAKSFLNSNWTCFNWFLVDSKCKVCIYCLCPIDWV